MGMSELTLFRQAIMQSWNSVVITDADAGAGYRVQIVNPAFCAMTGYSAEELHGCSLKMLQGPGTDAAVLEEMRACLKQERFFEGTAINYRKDGGPYTVRWSISPVHDDSGKLTHFVSVQQDISAYVQSEQKNRILAQALDTTSEAVMILDTDWRIVFVNKSFSDLTGYPEQDLLGQTPDLFKSGMEEPGYFESKSKALEAGQVFRGISVKRRKDGSLYHVNQSITPIFGRTGKATHYISISRDISEFVAREKTLRDAADHDRLTGLFNRHYGDRALGQAYRDAKTSGLPLALIMCDIDRFKQINDRFGHLAGDRVLADVAGILRECVRSSDVVVRWGGEEFLVILANCPQARAFELAERMRVRVSAHADPEVGGATISLGLASLAPDEGLDAFIARADAALYRSKHDATARQSRIESGNVGIKKSPPMAGIFS